MGGEAAKERRRLKRLQEQRQEADGEAKTLGLQGGTSAEAVVSVGKKQRSRAPTPNRTDADFQKTSADNVRLRLARKIARKASGKFKAQSQSEGAHGSILDKKGKAKSHRLPSNAERIYSKENGRSSQNTAVRSKFSKRKGVRPVVKKKTNAKLKPKKPKHLKRKMDQLSRSMSDGGADGVNNLSVLEDQMQELINQMQEYKRLKEKNVGSDEKNGKDKQTSNNTQPDGNEGRTANIERKDFSPHADNSPSKNVDDDEDTHPTESGTRQQTPTEPSIDTPTLSKSPGDDSSFHDDEIFNHPTARSRGKRRRGRRGNNAEKQNLEGNGSDANELNTASKTAAEDDASWVPLETDKTPPASPVNEALEPNKKTTKKDDKRRCIGRKPVTDFIVGGSYSGKVRYVKPELGAFIDIGCHSDAFCHISCISDEFVSSVTDVLQVDDPVENVRVVEVNREKKRITVSLRSKDKAEHEREKLNFARRQEGGQHSVGNGGDVNRSMNNAPPEKNHVRFDSKLGTCGNSSNISAKSAESSKPAADLKRERKLARRAERRAQRELSGSSPPLIGGCAKNRGELPAEKSKADLKRERKLARRAERRAEREAANKTNKEIL